MIIEFDFEIYKRGDYDKVYLRNGKEVRILCDNGKGIVLSLQCLIIIAERIIPSCVMIKLAGDISINNQTLISCYQ